MTYDSDGHGALTTFDPCLLGHAFGYLINGTLPPAGTVCEDVTEPFPASARDPSTVASAPWPIDVPAAR